jgi:hypothetical protein
MWLLPQIPVPRSSLLPDKEETYCQFLTHYQGIMEPGHFFRAGIRDAE